MDPAVLGRIIPGAERVIRAADDIFIATLGLGVGPFRGRQTVTLRVTAAGSDSLVVAGRAAGPFGTGEAVGRIDLRRDGAGTLIAWCYDGVVNGPVTLAGAYLIRCSATMFTNSVFAALRRTPERAA